MSKAADMAKWDREFEPDAKVDCEQLSEETGRQIAGPAEYGASP